MRKRVQGTGERGNHRWVQWGGWSLRWVGTIWMGEHWRRDLRCLGREVGSGQVRPGVGRSISAVPEATPESLRPAVSSQAAGYKVALVSK